jgi:hypothetical protein
MVMLQICIASKELLILHDIIFVYSRHVDGSIDITGREISVWKWLEIRLLMDFADLVNH